MIAQRFCRWLGPFLLCISWTALGQPAPLETSRNMVLTLPAAALTTNGIPGLTNTAPRLMVSGVGAVSANGGSVAILNAQAWVNRYDDPVHSQDFGAAEAVDSAGNLIVIGSSAGFSTGYDMAIFKYAGDGTPLWTNFYNGPADGDDFGVVVGVDAMNNVYAVVSSSSNDTDNTIELLKYSSNGTALWTNLYHSAATNNDFPTSFAVDAAGNSYIFVTTYSASPMAFVTLKYDATGHAIWTNVYQGPTGGPDYPTALALDSAGNIFVTGIAEGTPPDFEEIATIKYGGDGTALWTNFYGGDVFDQPDAIKVDHAGNVLVTGDALNAPSHFYVTIKYANNGVPLWTNLMEGPNCQGGNVPEVVVDASNNVFITGGSPDFDGTNVNFTILKLTGAGVPVWTNIFFDPNSGNPAPAGSAADAAGNYYFTCPSTGAAETNVNYVTVKFSAAGVPLWTNRYDDPMHGPDYPTALITDGAGNAYVTGQSTGMFGLFDFATVKYSDYIVYTPPTNFVGTDKFTFSVVDFLGNATNSVATVTVLPPPLQFNTAPPNLQLSAQGFRLEVDDAIGSNPVVLLASSNLINWQPILSNVPVLGTALFLDAAATNSSRRFYRASQSQ
jgi:hypothetical protein